MTDPTTDPTHSRQQLVDCIRMLERADIIDYNGHASIRAGDQRMFINSGACQRSHLTTADICTVDFEGTLLPGARKFEELGAKGVKALPEPAPVETTPREVTKRI